MKPLDLLQLAPEAWRTMEPSGGRAWNRISERELERIPARLHSRGDAAPVKLWDFSPSGFAFIYTYCKDHPFKAKEGDSVRVTLATASGELECDCVVRNTSLFKGNLRIGLSRKSAEAELVIPGAEGGVAVPPSLRISAEAANPILYGEWAALELLGVYSGLRMAFISRDPTLLILPGQVLDVELGLPLPGKYRCRLRVTAVGRHDDSSVALLTAPLSLDDGVAEELAGLLMREGAAPRDALRALGLPARLSREYLEYRFAEGQADEALITALRREAFPQGEGARANPERGNKALRRRAVLCAFHEGNLVACATFTLPDSDRAVLQSQAAFPGEQLPIALPDKAEIVELTGVTIHRDFRRESLLRSLLEQVTRIFLLSGRRYLLRLADERLVPDYRRLGFRALGAGCERFGRPHQLMALEAGALVSGSRAHSACWTAFFGDAVSDLIAKGLVKPDAWTAFRVACRRKAAPWIQKLGGAAAEKTLRAFLSNPEGMA